MALIGIPVMKVGIVRSFTRSSGKGYGPQKKDQCSQALIGQVTFHRFPDCSIMLATAWVHPFYRKEGLLTQLWPKLVKLYGAFKVHEPNRNMQLFLNKVGHLK